MFLDFLVAVLREIYSDERWQMEKNRSEIYRWLGGSQSSSILMENQKSGMDDFPGKPPVIYIL